MTGIDHLCCRHLRRHLRRRRRRRRDPRRIQM